jgi:hypothetical protein
MTGILDLLPMAIFALLFGTFTRDILNPTEPETTPETLPAATKIELGNGITLHIDADQ